MRHSSIATTAIAAALALAATATVTSAALADTGRSQVTFLARQSEVDLDGRFRQFSADIDFDPAHPESGRIKVAIDLASTDAGSADADNLLKSKEFFDVAHFPSATFEASSISAAGNGTYQATGRFTLKGHSADIVIPFTTRRDGAGLWFEGGTRISRLAYQVGVGQWSDTGTLEDEVQIRFKLQMAR